MKKIWIAAVLLLTLAMLASCAQVQEAPDPDPEKPGQEETQTPEDETPAPGVQNPGAVEPEPAPPQSQITPVSQAETVDGWAYFTASITEDGKTGSGVCRSKDGESQVLYRGEDGGAVDYVAGSYAGSDNTGLYFTVAGKDGTGLHLFDLYSQSFQRVIGAQCSNMVVFSATGGALDGLGWILYNEYILPVKLSRQTLEMQMAVSIQDLAGAADLGNSFFGEGKTASVSGSDYGVLEITVTDHGVISQYLYTCETFHLQKIS